MQLTQVGDDGQVVRLRCANKVTLADFLRPGHDPIAEVLGPGGFGRKVLLDLERVSFIDSSGISWLLISHKHFVQGGGLLVVHSAPPLVANVLKLLRLELVLNLAADEEAARARALGGKS